MPSKIKLSTVNRTSIIISLYTCILMIVLGIVFNIGYFLTRYPQEKAILQDIQQDHTFTTSLPDNESIRENLTWRDVLLQQAGNQNIKNHNQSRYYFISNSSPDHKYIIKKENIGTSEIQIISHNGYDFMSRPTTGGIVLVDISGYKEKEDMLLTLTLILLLFMVGTIFFITRILITRSLKDLTKLESYTNKLNAEKIVQPLVFEHLTTQDPIQRLSQAIFHFHTEQFTYTENMRQFMSSIAHEIKTPLQVIQTKVDLETGQSRGSPNIVAIQKQVDHITELIDILSHLTFAQYQKLTFEPVDIDKIILNTVKDFEIHQSDRRRIFSSEPGGYIKNGNKASIVTILSNILQNAIKYSQSGSTISITASHNSCIITDQGIGMTHEQLSHIRDPFWQADSSRGKDSGFGLGLTLVKKLITLHGWDIQCTSIKNKGTTFIISR